jgi:hypothetical protein
MTGRMTFEAKLISLQMSRKNLTPHQTFIFLSSSMAYSVLHNEGQR